MSEFTVTWIIDIEADSALEAAQKAQEIQRDPDSIATVFSVMDRSTDGDNWDVDLATGEVESH